MGSNRTFMELKSGRKTTATIWIKSSNRTFMELKLDYYFRLARLKEVLIVPLWN